MKVKALKPVRGTHRIDVGQVGELPDEIAKVFIEHGCVEAVKDEPGKTEKPKKARKKDGEE